eukprot:3992559-Amphidinium_carterae.1
MQETFEGHRHQCNIIVSAANKKTKRRRERGKNGTPERFVQTRNRQRQNGFEIWRAITTTTATTTTTTTTTRLLGDE